MPERFGGFWVVHTCFSRWSPSEVWEKVFHPLAEDSDKEYAIINTEIVRAHQHSAGGGRQLRRTGRYWPKYWGILHPSHTPQTS
ncbi:MAG: hypothetical protein O4965_25510 [Trichodesmium sp. St19_bin1]|nr:hypothetical protein [Trichodesmium sp. St19_bin1]